MNSAQAMQLCRYWHEGQERKDGAPYYTHPFRVAQGFPEDSDESIVAYLHDLLEDTDITMEQLRKMGLTATQEGALIALTRSPGEEYAGYIDRISENELAVRVKLADLQDNMPTAPAELKERYEKAWKKLQGETQ